jgi:hypothetical protein
MSEEMGTCHTDVHVSDCCHEMCLQVFYQSVSGFDVHFPQMANFSAEMYKYNHVLIEFINTDLYSLSGVNIQ